MSNASRDRTGRRVAQRLGWLAMALVLSLALVVALIVGRAYVPARAGIGDPYYPDAGGSGYDALSYAVDITYDQLASAFLSGTTVVTLRTTQALDVVHLDLKLAVVDVEVDGATAEFTQQGSDLAVRLPTVAGIPTTPAGKLLDIRVTYSGSLAGVTFPDKASPVYWNGRETLIAGEPEAASVWFPSDDHPSDPATYDITVHVPKDVEAISVGTLVSHGPDPTRSGEDVWHWRTDTPSPTYTTMLTVGQFIVETVPVQIDGVERTAVYAVSEGLPDTKGAMDWLKKSQAAIPMLERHLGRYPVDALGGVMSAIYLNWGGIETLGRPVYDRREVGYDETEFHELSHQWLGDTVTLRDWRDIFINEAMATYVEWMLYGETGKETPQQDFDELYGEKTSQDEFWAQQLSDPGTTYLFTHVYDKGPMAVHALRNRMGEEAFSRFLLEWAGQTGPRSLDDWRTMAQKDSPVDVRPLLAAWLDGTDKVPATTENGFR